MVVHIIGISCLGYYSFRTLNTEDELRQIRALQLGYFATLLQFIAVISSFLLMLLSLKSEAMISQTYELAANATQATSQKFNSFKAHIVWLKDHLSPRQFPDARNVSIMVSTPAYGIGADVDSAKEFVDYFESWVRHFGDHDQGSSRPTLQLTVWQAENNRRTFGIGVPKYDWTDKERLAVLQKYSETLKQAYALHDSHRINLELYLTGESHIRLFLVDTGTRCAGLSIQFSPLTPPAIEHDGWGLVGFGFRSREAYENVAAFASKLQNSPQGKGRPLNKVDELRTPAKWLKRHYGLSTGIEKPGKTGPD